MGSPLKASAHPEFAAWAAERRRLEKALDDTPEAKDPAGRERLFDRAFDLERLILTTPSDALEAIRVKVETLIWLMEMDGSDGLPAMQHIKAFIDRLA